jgi:hypothetical protein
MVTDDSSDSTGTNATRDLPKLDDGGNKCFGIFVIKYLYDEDDDDESNDNDDK